MAVVAFIVVVVVVVVGTVVVVVAVDLVVVADAAAAAASAAGCGGSGVGFWCCRFVGIVVALPVLWLPLSLLLLLLRVLFSSCGCVCCDLRWIARPGSCSSRTSGEPYGAHSFWVCET